MADFNTFCKRYELDPKSKEARDQYAEANANLQALFGASAKVETEEAIEKAKRK